MRALLPGSKLNEIAGSLQRWPKFQVVIWNPLRVTLNDIAAGTVSEAGLDITAFVQTATYTQNIGFENGDDPSTTQASFRFRRHPNTGQNLRRGMIEDGVIVQIRQGDARVVKADWVPIFTGTFRGRPGDDPGTPADQTEGFTASAFGREERFLNLTVTTEAFEQDTDVGVMAVSVAQKHMGLTQNEILFGAQGFESRHKTNQLVELPALQALWECLFTVGKKPMFDSLGRLAAVDVSLDKPAARVYSGGNSMFKSVHAVPNDVEVNNAVVLRGLSATLTKVVGEVQRLTELSVVTGFFDSEFKERVFYSDDRSQRAQNTYVVERKKIRWSDADWEEINEFHGRLTIDTRHLRNVRAIIFTLFLAIQTFIAIVDLYFQGGGNGLKVIFDIFGISFTIAKLRYVLQLASMGTLAALLWSMNYIGRGEYEIWGKPFEFVYRELIAEHQLVNLGPDDVRRAEYRNDFLSSMAQLDAAAAERLRREVLKNQVYQVVMLDDPLIEIDDVIEDADGNRYYVVSVEKVLEHEAEPLMTLTCWRIYESTPALVSALALGTEA